jgi:hypothetical protein
MDYSIARKTGYNESLPQAIYKNLMHVWRGAWSGKRTPQEAIDYIQIVKTKRPEIYRGFIKTIRTMSKHQLRPFRHCEHEGCRETNTVDCQLYYDGKWHKYEYCHEHCEPEGFCPGCGHFWAGTEYFDFNLGRSGMCQDCTDTYKYELGEYDDDYYDEYFDEFHDYEDEYSDDF